MYTRLLSDCYEKRVARICQALRQRLKSVTRMIMAVHSVILNLNGACAVIGCIKRDNIFLKCRRSHKGFVYRARLISSGNRKIHPLILDLIARFLRFFILVGNFLKLVNYLIIGKLIRLVAIEIGKRSHRKHGACFAVHNNAVGSLALIFFKSCTKIFFECVLYILINSKNK